MSEDRWLTCQDCGDEFVFTARDQQFYKQKGYEEPKRCKPCRELKKSGYAERGET